MFEDLAEAGDNAHYELAITMDGVPTAPWPTPTPEEFEAAKADFLERNPRALDDKNEAAKGILGKYLTGKCRGEWKNSKEQRELVNMHFVRQRHVELDDFTEFRVLGRGAFGLVKGVCRNCSGHMFANKIQHKGRMKEGRSMSLALEEKNALMSVTSDFVIGLHYSFQDDNNVYLILELLSGGDLQFHLNNEKKFSEDVAKYFIASTLQGIGAVHDAGFVYRDLKPENILLSAEGNCKISDMGLVTRIGKGITGSAGTRGFYAPEMITKTKDGKHQVYTEVVDFWSLGCVVYSFFDGASPFYDKKRIAEYDSDINLAINEATKKMVVEYNPENFSPTCANFTDALLNRDPNLRLGANGWQEIEKHQFFSDFDFEALRNQKMKPPFVPIDTLNSKDSNEIGEHEGKGASWEKKDEEKFKDWDYVNENRFEKEVVATLEYAAENGDLRETKKSLACLIL